MSRRKVIIERLLKVLENMAYKETSNLMNKLVLAINEKFHSCFYDPSEDNIEEFLETMLEFEIEGY